MSRSQYNDDIDNWQLIKWRGMVASSIRGKRGQKFLSDLLVSLDAMPDKRLIANDLEADGDVCAIGSLGKARGLNMTAIDPEDPPQVAAAFNIAECLAQEVVYENDEGAWMKETPEERWKRMRKWVASKIKATA
jgi:hypothetical protein